MVEHSAFVWSSDIAERRAYPGPEFVLANTLAKWKKLEPNATNFKKYQQVVLYLILCPLSLLITFANSLDPDQARQNVGPDLDPNFLTLR